MPPIKKTDAAKPKPKPKPKAKVDKVKDDKPKAKTAAVEKKDDKPKVVDKGPERAPVTASAADAQEAQGRAQVQGNRNNKTTEVKAENSNNSVQEGRERNVSNEPERRGFLDRAKDAAGHLVVAAGHAITGNGDKAVERVGQAADSVVEGSGNAVEKLIDGNRVDGKALLNDAERTQNARGINAQDELDSRLSPEKRRDAATLCQSANSKFERDLPEGYTILEKFDDDKESGFYGAVVEGPDGEKSFVIGGTDFGGGLGNDVADGNRKIVAQGEEGVPEQFRKAEEFYRQAVEKHGEIDNIYGQSMGGTTAQYLSAVLPEDIKPETAVSFNGPAATGIVEKRLAEEGRSLGEGNSTNVDNIIDIRDAIGTISGEDNKYVVGGNGGVFYLNPEDKGEDLLSVHGKENFRTNLANGRISVMDTEQTLREDLWESALERNAQGDNLAATTSTLAGYVIDPAREQAAKLNASVSSGVNNFMASIVNGLGLNGSRPVEVANGGLENDLLKGLNANPFDLSKA